MKFSERMRNGQKECRKCGRPTGRRTEPEGGERKANLSLSTDECARKSYCASVCVCVFAICKTSETRTRQSPISPRVSILEPGTCSHRPRPLRETLMNFQSFPCTRAHGGTIMRCKLSWTLFSRCILWCLNRVGKSKSICNKFCRFFLLEHEESGQKRVEKMAGRMGSKDVPARGVCVQDCILKKFLNT